MTRPRCGKANVCKATNVLDARVPALGSRRFCIALNSDDSSDKTVSSSDETVSYWDKTVIASAAPPSLGGGERCSRILLVDLVGDWEESCRFRGGRKPHATLRPLELAKSRPVLSGSLEFSFAELSVPTPRPALGLVDPGYQTHRGPKSVNLDHAGNTHLPDTLWSGAVKSFDMPDRAVLPSRGPMPNSVGTSCPILLGDAGFYGTLAATRCLGEIGVPVHIASDSVLATSRWSRYTSRALRSPPIAEAEQFLDWLFAVGKREPGTVLCATSDDTLYLYALRRAELASVFRMYIPSFDTVLSLLDKRRLYAIARSVGLEVPDTWFPETDAEVERLAREIPMPVLIKPRTQILFRTHSKGAIVRERSQLSSTYRDFVRGARFGRALLDHVPDAAQAMIQSYVDGAGDNIYLVSGFVDESGSLKAARSAVKIFQRPRSLGIGVCFESAPMVPTLCDKVFHLFRAAGYHGIFQLEFIAVGDRHLLIDCNPRLYNWLALDLVRGLPLPRMAYAAACGQTQELARLVADASAWTDPRHLVFCNDFGLNVMLWSQRIAGRIPASEVSRWRRWRRDHRGSMVEPTFADNDLAPGYFDVANHVYEYARHPRAFLRKIVFDQTGL